MQKGQLATNHAKSNTYKSTKTVLQAYKTKHIISTIKY